MLPASLCPVSEETPRRLLKKCFAVRGCEIALVLSSHLPWRSGRSELALHQSTRICTRKGVQDQEENYCIFCKSLVFLFSYPVSAHPYPSYICLIGTNRTSTDAQDALLDQSDCPPVLSHFGTLEAGASTRQTVSTFMCFKTIWVIMNHKLDNK